jgi:hypothetical protein
MGAFIFFSFLAAIILVPQVLIYNDRRRLHETLRIAFERGQPIPPELIMALQPRRRRYRYDPYDFAPAAAWTPPQTAASPSPATAETPMPPNPPHPPADAPAAAPPPPPIFINPVRSDLRRGLIWLAVGLGLIAAGGAFYAGLYDVGGAPETFGTFAAFGAIPAFIGATYLGLWWFEGRKTKV